jgi:hypothetical protein
VRRSTKQKDPEMNDTPTLQTPAAGPAPELPDEQLPELRTMIGEIRGAWSSISVLPGEFKTLKDGADKFASDLRDVRRQLLSRPSPHAARRSGQVSEDCARHLAAQFIAQCERSDKLEALSSVSGQRDALLNFARHTLNVMTRTALTANDINLPAQYGSEIRELISEFGVVRRRMSPYPIGMGTARPARMGARPALGSRCRR